MTDFSSVNRNIILTFCNNDNNDNNKNNVLSTENYYSCDFHFGIEIWMPCHFDMRTCVKKIIIMVHFTWVYFFHSFLFLMNAFSPRINPSWVGVYNNEIFSCVFVHTIESPVFFREMSTFQCFWVELTWLDYVRHLLYYTYLMCITLMVQNGYFIIHWF